MIGHALRTLDSLVPPPDLVTDTASLAREVVRRTGATTLQEVAAALGVELRTDRALSSPQAGFTIWGGEDRRPMVVVHPDDDGSTLGHELGHVLTPGRSTLGRPQPRVEAWCTEFGAALQVALAEAAP